MDKQTLEYTIASYSYYTQNGGINELSIGQTFAPLLADGWKPQGGVVISGDYSYSGGITYTQAFVREAAPQSDTGEQTQPFIRNPLAKDNSVSLHKVGEGLL